MLRNTFLSGITKYWWLPLITGLVCIGLGVWSICCPSGALPILAMIFAIGLLVVGAVDLIWGIATSKHNPGWGWDLCLGILDVIAGIWMLTMNTQEMTLTFLYIIGIWLIFAAFNGLGQIFAISVYNPLATFLAALLLLGTLFFSFWIIFNPIALGVTAWMWIGIALCCYGVFRLAAAFKIKNLHDRIS